MWNTVHGRNRSRKFTALYWLSIPNVDNRDNFFLLTLITVLYWRLGQNNYHILIARSKIQTDGIYSRTVCSAFIPPFLLLIALLEDLGCLTKWKGKLSMIFSVPMQAVSLIPIFQRLPPLLTVWDVPLTTATIAVPSPYREPLNAQEILLFRCFFSIYLTFNWQDAFDIDITWIKGKIG